MTSPTPLNCWIRDGNSFWSYVQCLTYGNRAVLPQGISQGTNEILHACEGRLSTFQQGEFLYRARLCPPFSNRPKPKKLECKEMTAPRSDRAPGQRLNPAGIPYLYLSSDLKTCIAELRPWRGAWLTVAEFVVSESFRVFDVTKLTDAEERQLREKREEHAVERPGKKHDLLVIRLVARELSIPAHHDDQGAYGATQYISENLKALGTGPREPRVEGIRYSSAMNPSGFNVALFGQWGVGSRERTWDDLVKCKEETKLHQVTKTVFEFA